MTHWRQQINETLAEGNLAKAAAICDQWSSALVDNITHGDQGEPRNEDSHDDVALAESVMREGISHLRSLGNSTEVAPGYVEGITMRLFTRLATLVSPSPEAMALAEEMVATMKSGRAHPMDVAETMTYCTQIALSCLPIDQATPYAIEAVKRNEGVCFHENSQEVEEQVAQELRKANRVSEAEQWESGVASGRQGLEVGHVHLWGLQFAEGKGLVPIPEHEYHDGPKGDLILALFPEIGIVHDDAPQEE
ncbi:MAG: hypothetical protein FWG08_03635 [Propionibacteriaceae bacterium]|jgi:hypothetical protein|nr:hypothetical protein [Propionibacteriaceae bacterium]